MPVELPYDIWRCIADYLDDKEVETLYPVNRALFNVSMNERYKEAVIGLPLRRDRRPQRKDIQRFRYESQVL